MKIVSAKDASYDFSRLIHLARTALVVTAEHRNPAVVVMAVECSA